MNITFKLLLFLFLGICFSCEEQGLIVKCPDCFADEPLKAELEIMLENPNNYPEAIIQIWEGNLEDSILFKSFSHTTFSTTVSEEVTLNKKYTVTARYNMNTRTYIVVDSATPRVKYNKDQCDEPCYFVYDRIIDLRLKYTK